jgi:integrase
MSRLRLPAIIVGVAALIALLDYFTSAELAGSVLFTFPLVLCIRQRSKWMLWGTSAVATLLAVAAGVWSFHRIELGNPELINPWIASLNRGLLVASLLTLSTLIHLWINKSHQLALEAAELEQHSNRLTAGMEQLENELMKFRTAAKARRKPVLLTVKQYQAFVGQLSDLHKTMVVTAMCSGMRVSEVLALRWNQMDFAAGLIHGQQGFGGNGEAKTAAGSETISMDPVLAEALLEWRNKNPGSNLVFPSHITGRCYHPGPIQQDYFRPAARKLGLSGVCWHTFPDSYRSWLNEDGAVSGAVQQKLMRHADGSTITNIHVNGSLKTKAKTKRETSGKIGRRISPAVRFPVGVTNVTHPNENNGQTG